MELLQSLLAAVSVLGTGVSPSTPALFPVGIVAGALATLAMDRVMARIDSGTMPPRIASGVLTDRHADDAPQRLADAVHYIAGLFTGALYVWLVVAAHSLLGSVVLSGLLAALVCYPLMVGFFALVVLPRSRGLPRQRLRAIRRAWSVEAAVYLAVLAPLVTVAAVTL